MPSKWSAAKYPCNKLIIPPPMIIEIKKFEPSLVCLPSPEMDSVKMQGHKVEQNNPTLQIAYTLICASGEKIAINKAAIPNKLKINNCLDGLPMLRRLAMINATITAAYIKNGCRSCLAIAFTNKNTPKAR